MGGKQGKGDDQNDPTETTATLSETIAVVNRLWLVVVLKLILSSLYARNLNIFTLIQENIEVSVSLPTFFLLHFFNSIAFSRTNANFLFKIIYYT